MDQLHSSLPKRLDIQMTPGTAQIVQADEFNRRVMIEQAMGNAAPGETADSGEEKLHFNTGILICCPV